MSGYFGNYSKDNLMDEMVKFLEENSISELLEIVRAAVEYVEDSE